MLSSSIRVAAWPMPPSNKADGNALTVLDRELFASAPFAKPQSDQDKDIAAIWQELPQIDKVSIDDNFFDLGGHSLLLVKLQSHLSPLLNKKLPLIEIFQYPTIRMLAKYFSGTTGNILLVIAYVILKYREIWCHNSMCLLIFVYTNRLSYLQISP